MQTLIDLTNIADLEGWRVTVRDCLASANVRPWTLATVRLENGRSFDGNNPGLG